MEQKLEKFWWTKKGSYMAYVIREFSGILIAIYVLTSIIFETLVILGPGNVNFVSALYAFRFSALFSVIQYLGLLGAIIHSLTWIPVMAKISPFEFSKKQSIVVTLLLFVLAAIISYLLSITFHAT